MANFKKDTSAKFTQFKRDGFLILIVETDDMFEAWIRHASYGVSDLMFGCPKQQSFRYDDFVELVFANADEYIDIYKDEYMYDVLHDKDNVRYRG